MNQNTTVTKLNEKNVLIIHSQHKTAQNLPVQVSNASKCEKTGFLHIKENVIVSNITDSGGYLVNKTLDRKV